MSAARHPDDAFWMREALALARKGEGRTRPNPPVGAVVVRAGRVVGRGWHRQAGGPHAEVYALRAAGARARGATLYVTLEPCCTWGRTPPCTDLILATGIRRVVVGTGDPNPRHAGRGFRVLRRAGVAVVRGVCRDEARALIAPFGKWVREGWPFVTLKMGMTLDGRIADARGRSRWITSPAARRAVTRLRRRVDAVLVGGQTVRADDPSLLPRAGDRGMLLRVIVSATGAISLRARALVDRHAGQTIVATTRQCPAARQAALGRGGARVWVLPSRGKRVALAALMRRLGREGLLHVLCEGGGELAADMIRGRLVDELQFFIAPKLLGGSGVPVVGGGGWSLAAAPTWRVVGCERVGADVLVRAVSLCSRV